MNLRNISIRSRYFLLLVFSVMFWMVCGLILLGLIKSIGYYQETTDKISGISGTIDRIERSVLSFYKDDLSDKQFYQSRRSSNLQQIKSDYLGTYSVLNELRQDRLISGNPVLLQKITYLSRYFSEINNRVDDLEEKSRTRGWRDSGLSGLIIQDLDSVDNFPVPISIINAYLEYPDMENRNKIIGITNRYFNSTNQSDNLSYESEFENYIIHRIYSNLRTIVSIDIDIGRTSYEGIQGEINTRLQILREELRSIVQLNQIQSEQKTTRLRILIFVLILGGSAVFALIFSFLNRSLSRNLEALTELSSELESGRMPDEVKISDTNEFHEIGNGLSKFISSLRNKTNFAEQLSEGRETELIESLSQEDRLAKSLSDLERNLLESRTEEEKHRVSREERRWANEGIGKFGDLLRIHNKNITELSENVIEELVDYLDASAGGIYLLNDEEEDTYLDLIASFAYDRKKYLKHRFKMGEGLPGTCAIEKEKIYIDEIPDDYISISSGLGGSKPVCLLLVPLLLEESTLGVIEIASLKIFADFEVEFIENLAESIASAVSSVQINMRTSELLEQSQNQAQEMAKQEEIMRQNMEELQATQDESARRETEISGILNAIHNSTHVAEFNVEETLLGINNKFLQLLQVQKQQIIGKKYHEIIGVNRYTEAYKKFWTEIKGGKTITRIDKIQLSSGENIWLRQTFTPITGPDGQLLKVLNIAADITETIEQRESIEKQSNEIKRANIEMQSFSDAVDKALIKCVYSSSGQIMELNENFEQITGFTSNEMVGKNNRVFLKKVEREQFDRIWEDIIKDKPYSGVIRRTKPTGEEVWLMSTFTPVKDETGTVFKVIFLGQDITERKLKYQLLEEANKEIDRLRQQVDDSG